MHTWTLDKPDNLVEWWEESAAKFADRRLLGTKTKKGCTNGSRIRTLTRA